MSAQHTPGPWEFDGESRIDAVALRKPTGHIVEKEDGTKVDYIGGLVALPYGCGGCETHRANALLIAAAPELLDALETARSGLLWYRESFPAADSQADDEAMEQIDAAIEKATGAKP